MPEPIEPPVPIEPEPKPLEPEHYDIDGKTKYRIGGRLFLIEKKDIEKEQPMFVQCDGENGGRKHILFPKSQKFIDIERFTESEIAEIKKLL